MSSSCTAAPDPAVGAQVSVTQDRCPHSVTGEDGPKDPPEHGFSPPHSSAQCFPVFPVQHRWAVGSSPPFHPLWQGWCFRIFVGTVPKGQVAEAQCPQLCLLSSWSPWSCQALGMLLDVARPAPAPGVVQGWGGHSDHPCPGLPAGLGTPGTGTPLQGMSTAPLCQPCTVRGTRSREIFHPFKGSKDRRGASCHRPGALGFAPSLCCGWLQCQGRFGSMPGGGKPGSGAREEEGEGSSSPGEALATGSLLAPLTPPAQGAK